MIKAKFKNSIKTVKQRAGMNKNRLKKKTIGELENLKK